MAKTDMADVTDSTETSDAPLIDLNDASVKGEGRLMSRYQTDNGTSFWIITEWDRSVTTILLPLEY